MATSKMVLKCAKTGRLFFSTEEATEHAEAFGKDYANFDEVALDLKVWICVETGRPAYTEQDMQRLKMRDPESKTWEEKTIAYMMELQKKKDEIGRRKDRFLASVDQKKLEILSMKSHGRQRSAKALYHTKATGTVEAAEAWLAENADSPDVDKLSDEFLNGVFGGADVAMGEAGADVEMAVVDDRKVGDPNPPEIKESINQELLKQVMEMGFSELRSEKALYKTDNVGLEYAVNWLGDHSEDADIDLPLLKPAVPKPKMSDKDAEAKLLELQRKLREKKAADAKEAEKEKERERVEYTKRMAVAQEAFKQDEAKRAIEQIQREKSEHERHKAELKETLRQDYIERFGVEPPEKEEGAEIQEKSGKDKVAFFLNKLKKTYFATDKEGLKTCLSTLKIYIKNMHENPMEPKFKTLKLDNKAFQTRVAPFDGAIDLLDALGFEKKEDCLQQRKSVPDGFLCGNATKFIDLILGQM